MFNEAGEWSEAPYYAGLTNEQLLAESRVAITQISESMEVLETFIRRENNESKKD